MDAINLTETLIGREVERLFSENPAQSNGLCTNHSRTGTARRLFCGDRIDIANIPLACDWICVKTTEIGILLNKGPLRAISCFS